MQLHVSRDITYLCLVDNGEAISFNGAEVMPAKVSTGHLSCTQVLTNVHFHILLLFHSNYSQHHLL